MQRKGPVVLLISQLLIEGFFKFGKVNIGIFLFELINLFQIASNKLLVCFLGLAKGPVRCSLG